jgi:CO/xanthine dehydrogenase Mo-binding subunit
MYGPTSGYPGPEKAGQKMGDVQQGFAEADQILEFTYNRTEETAHVEPVCCSVWWKNDHYEYALAAQMNNTFLEILSSPCGLPQTAGFQHAVYSGGGFGVGYQVSNWVLWSAIIVSQRLMRPVKVMYTMQQGYYSSISDDCGTETFKVGFKNDGTITAVQSDTDYPGPKYETGLSHLEENTCIPNFYAITRELKLIDLCLWLFAPNNGLLLWELR